MPAPAAGYRYCGNYSEPHRTHLVKSAAIYRLMSGRFDLNTSTICRKSKSAVIGVGALAGNP
jgi:hypothetical protein